MGIEKIGEYIRVANNSDTLRGLTGIEKDITEDYRENIKILKDLRNKVIEIKSVLSQNNLKIARERSFIAREMLVMDIDLDVDKMQDSDVSRIEKELKRAGADFNYNQPVWSVRLVYHNDLFSKINGNKDIAIHI